MSSQELIDELVKITITIMHRPNCTTEEDIIHVRNRINEFIKNYDKNDQNKFLKHQLSIMRKINS